MSVCDDSARSLLDTELRLEHVATCAFDLARAIQGWDEVEAKDAVALYPRVRKARERLDVALASPDAVCGKQERAKALAAYKRLTAGGGCRPV